jgi:hypothetical protein
MSRAPTAETVAPTSAPSGTAAPTAEKQNPSKLPVEEVVQILIALDVFQLNEVSFHLRYILFFFCFFLFLSIFCVADSLEAQGAAAREWHRGDCDRQADNLRQQDRLLHTRQQPGRPFQGGFWKG